MAKEALRNILTFGADGRVARRFEEYVPLVVQLAEAEASAQGMRSEVAEALERLQGTKREAVEWLKRLALEDMPDDARAAFAHAEVPAEDDVPSITVTRPLSSADVGVHLSGPLGAVASAAAGLVGTIGVSGAGAASATATVLGSEVLGKALAWLGVSAAAPAAAAPLSVIAVAAVVAQAVGGSGGQLPPGRGCPDRQDREGDRQRRSRSDEAEIGGALAYRRRSARRRPRSGSPAASRFVLERGGFGEGTLGASVLVRPSDRVGQKEAGCTDAASLP